MANRNKMGAITNLRTRVQRVYDGLKSGELIRNVVIRHPDDILELQKIQLFQGLASDGEDIRPYYSEDLKPYGRFYTVESAGRYAAWKMDGINYPYSVRKDNRDASFHDQYCMTNGVSAIISEEEFKAVQEEKKRRNPYDENGNRKPQKYSSKKLSYLSTNSKENGNIVDNISTELPGSD